MSISTSESIAVAVEVAGAVAPCHEAFSMARLTIPSSGANFSNILSADVLLSAVPPVGNAIININATNSTSTSTRTHDDQAPIFTETMSSSYWMVSTIFTIAICLHAYRHWHIPKITSRTLAMINLAMCMTAMIPFLIYVVTKNSWSGGDLPELQRYLIDHLHLILMSLWAVVSTTQVLTAIFKAYRLHSILGWFALDVLLPAIIVELHTNASWVFVSTKSAALAQGHLLADAVDPTMWQTALYSLPFAAALLTPTMIAMFWWLSRSSLHDTKRIPNRAVRFRLHITYMTLLMTTICGTGFSRWGFRIAFRMTECPAHHHDIISIRIQHLATTHGACMLLMVATLIYMTIPKSMRQHGEAVATSASEMSISTRNASKGLRLSFYAFLMHGLLQLIATQAMDFPFAFKCDMPAIDAFISQHGL